MLRHVWTGVFYQFANTFSSGLPSVQGPGGEMALDACNLNVGCTLQLFQHLTKGRLCNVKAKSGCHTVIDLEVAADADMDDLFGVLVSQLQYEGQLRVIVHIDNATAKNNFLDGFCFFVWTIKVYFLCRNTQSLGNFVFHVGNYFRIAAKFVY